MEREHRQSPGEGAPQDLTAALEELARLDQQIALAQELADLKPLFYRLESITNSFADNAQIQARSTELKQRLVAQGMRLKERSNARTTAGVPAVAETPAPPPPPSFLPPTMAPPSQTAAAAPPPEPVPAGTAPVEFRWQRPVAAGVALGVLLFLALLGTVLKKPAGPAVKLIPVEIRSTPPGATVLLDGQSRGTSDLRLELAAGDYRLELRRPGYEPAFSALQVAAGAPIAIQLPLQPQPQGLRVVSDLGTGKVYLDGEPAGELQEGELSVDRIPPGPHQIRVAGAKAEASFGVEITPGEAPRLTGPVTAKEVFTLVSTIFGSRSHLRTSGSPAPIVLDSSLKGETGPEGLLLENLSPGDHELIVGQGADQRKFVLNAGPLPMVTAFLKLDLNAGTLVVVTGEDGVTVFLNGKPHRRKTTRGRLRISALPVQDYTVRVAKDGYQELPERLAAIRKGEEARLEFTLRPILQTAVLRIRDAMPGITVLLDRDKIGVVQPDGTFSASNISPGEHTVELRKERYNARRLPRRFEAGRTVELGGADAVLEKSPGTLRVSVTPADSRITIRRSDEAQGRPLREASVRLTEGTYVLTASAQDHIERSIQVDVVSGETRTAELALSRKKVEAPAPVIHGMEGWEQPGMWKPRDRWQVRKGGNFVLYRITPSAGTVIFTATVLRGRRLQYVADYRDAKNHILFQLDDKMFHRKLVSGGKTNDLARLPHSLKKVDFYTVQIDISEDSLITRLHDGNDWKVIDVWNDSSRGFNRGHFGLYIPGGDEYGLTNFSFRPK